MQRGELPHEAGVVEQTGHRVLGQRLQVAIVEAEDIGDRRLGRSRGRRVGAEEQQVVADGDDVPGDAGALGAHPAGAGQAELAGTEGRDPGLVEGPGTPAQLRRLPCEPFPEYRVRVLVDSRAHPVPLLVPWWIRVRRRQPPYLPAPDPL